MRNTPLKAFIKRSPLQEADHSHEEPVNEGENVEQGLSDDIDPDTISSVTQVPDQYGGTKTIWKGGRGATIPKNDDPETGEVMDPSRGHPGFSYLNPSSGAMGAMSPGQRKEFAHTQQDLIYRLGSNTGGEFGSGLGSQEFGKDELEKTFG